jgi:hypothetical protein
MDLNQSAPSESVPLGTAQTALVQQVKANYPPGDLNLYTRTFNVKGGATAMVKWGLHELPGFKDEVLDRNQFVQISHLVLRSVSIKTGSHCAAALTMDASASTSISAILSCKTAMFRRVTDLTQGMEEHSLPFNAGMSSVILPNNIAGRHVYFLLNATEGQHSLQLYYYRGAGAIASSVTDVLPPTAANPVSAPSAQPSSSKSKA